MRRNTQLDPIRVTPSRRPGTKTLEKVQEESSLRSRPEKDSTRKGDLIAKARDQTPGRCRKSLRFDQGLRQTRPGRVTSSRRHGAIYRSRGPEGTCFIKLEGGQMVEAGEHTPEPINWRGTTMKLPRTELRLNRWGQLRTVHGRETSGNEAMARPPGN